MKTKNFLLTGALLIMALFSVNGVMAQTPAKIGNTKVHIVLSPMQAITVNQTDVTLTYTSIDDYNNGVDTTMTSHLTVYSVGGFIVNVKSGGNFIGKNGSIEAEDVIITATAAGDSPGGFTDVRLSTTEAPLITSNKGGFKMDYNVNYSNKLAGKDFKNAAKKGGTYTAQVTYEIFSN